MVYVCPQQIDKSKLKSIFLAGTIDMGISNNWQEEITQHLISYNFDIYNPRRLKWDSSWKQIPEDANFYQQVNWELDALDRADCILFNFLKNSTSPISLLELGLYATSKKIVVICDKEFYRYGNVSMVCHKYDIPLFNDVPNSIKHLLEMLSKLHK